jgi:hypothetical protein
VILVTQLNYYAFFRPGTEEFGELNWGSWVVWLAWSSGKGNII